MFVRRTQTRSTASGDRYFTFRLVHSERVGARVRQRTLLNLGRHFAIPQADWPLLCVRLEQLLSRQQTLIPATVPSSRKHVAAQLLARQVALGAAPAKPTGGAAECQRAATQRSGASDFEESDRVTELFRYDLTNTYFEGVAAAQPLASGHC